MRKKITAVCSTCILFIITIIIRRRYFPKPSAEAHYYFSAIFLIAAVLIAIFCVMILYERKKKARPRSPLIKYTNDEDLRDDYRISHWPGTEPTLLVNRRNENSNRSYQLKIVNLSITGAKIQHNGLLKKQDLISGHITFSSGKVIEVSGKVIRILASDASLRFTTPLPPKVLMEEQRRLISQNEYHITTERNK